MSDKGFTDKVKGKVKKAVGDATGDNSAYLCFLQKVYFLIVQEYSKRCVNSKKRVRMQIRNILTGEKIL